MPLLASISHISRPRSVTCTSFLACPLRVRRASCPRRAHLARPTYPGAPRAAVAPLFAPISSPSHPSPALLAPFRPLHPFVPFAPSSRRAVSHPPRLAFTSIAHLRPRMSSHRPLHRCPTPACRCFAVRAAVTSCHTPMRLCLPHSVPLSPLWPPSRAVSHCFHLCCARSRRVPHQCPLSCPAPHRHRLAPQRCRQQRLPVP
ncbi:hypothetical protein DENSPDRAFT_87224 [Dentipellis sp. KUC8613]|nr:hypothetical protein DENSPDRAFT_87224 [Dentipellis sp. KUC8613]